jgi:hypothetical protein
MTWTNNFRPGVDCRVRWRSAWTTATVVRSTANSVVVEIARGSERTRVQVHDSRNIRPTADEAKAAKAAIRKAKALAMAERVQLALSMPLAEPRPLKQRRSGR